MPVHAPVARNLPKACPIGHSYYECRARDFELRHPGRRAPSYYRGYGTKYLVKFSKLTRKELSAEGIRWRERTMRLLQEAIEQRRRSNPELFARLEMNDFEFMKFAFATHPAAYVAGGLYHLPAEDLLVIMETIKDELLHPFADFPKWTLVIKQMADVIVIGIENPMDFVYIIESTIKDPRTKMIAEELIKAMQRALIRTMPPYDLPPMPFLR